MSHGDASTPLRRCNGGPNGTGWCGKPATVVCTEHGQGRPLPTQWYACDDAAHRTILSDGGERAAAHVEPIGEWFARILAPIDERR